MLKMNFLHDKGERFPWFPALAIYTSSYFMMFFFLNAKFWDDWMVNVQMSPSETHQYWKDMIAMFPTNRFVEISLLNRNPVAMHLLTFILHFLNGFFVFQILKRANFIKFSKVVAVTLIFLVLPINSARVAMVDFRYTYSLSLFLLGWYLLVQRKFRYLHFLSIAVFLSSFIVQSLLVFFIAPCIHLFFVNYLNNGISKIRSAILSLLFFALAPTYFVLVRLLDPPISSRTEYYTPSITGTFKGLILVAVTAFWMVNSLRKATSPFFIARNQLIAIGSFLVSIGSFAYMAADNLSDVSEWMLNFIPRASDWDSRHQLLMGMGLAFIIVGIIGDLHSRSKKQLFSIIVIACVSLNFIMMKSYFLDWRKQLEIIELVKSGEFDPSTKVIEVWDDVSARRFNARGRSIRNYEWEAILQYASGRKDLIVSQRSPIDCSASSQNNPDTLLRIEAVGSHAKAVLTGSPGVVISLHALPTCSDE